MRGKYSKNEFFKKHPSTNKIYFKGSELTRSQDVIDEMPIPMILFDKLDLDKKHQTIP